MIFPEISGMAIDQIEIAKIAIRNVKYANAYIA
jgi:hypothetical protein